MTDFSPYVAFSTAVLKSGIHSRAELENITRFHADDLKPIDGDPFTFLMAIAGIESSFCKDIGPRIEWSYGRSSLAYRRSALLKEGYAVWGDLCAMSYGAHQILWIVARELGYPLQSCPLDLASSVVSLPYVVELFNKNFTLGAKTMDDLAAAYNGGIGCLKFKTSSDKTKFPFDYVQKFRLQYAQIQGK